MSSHFWVILRRAAKNHHFGWGKQVAGGLIAESVGAPAGLPGSALFAVTIRWSANCHRHPLRVRLFDA
jgi:hypothetical protein